MVFFSPVPPSFSSLRHLKPILLNSDSTCKLIRMQNRYSVSGVKIFFLVNALIKNYRCHKMSQYHCNIFGAINSSLTYLSWEHLRLVTFVIQSQRVLTFTLLLLAHITPKCLHPEKSFNKPCRMA